MNVDIPHPATQHAYMCILCYKQHEHDMEGKEPVKCMNMTQKEKQKNCQTRAKGPRSLRTLGAQTTM